jgi:DNA-binding response OmpR family regulator
MKAARRWRILIVEDEITVMSFLRNVLQAKGFEAIGAATGADAIRLCQDRNQPIDLAIVDLVLTDGWGTKVAFEIREHCTDIPILVVSGTALQDWRASETAEFHSLGKAVYFLQKPFSARVLVTKIDEILNLRPEAKLGECT